MVQNFAVSVMDEVDLDASRYSGWKPFAIRDRIWEKQTSYTFETILSKYMVPLGLFRSAKRLTSTAVLEGSMITVHRSGSPTVE